jgi:NADH-quinone oxidoreductase subunit C
MNGHDEAQDQNLLDLQDVIADGLGNAILRYELKFDQLTLYVDDAQIIRVLTFLRDHPQCLFINFTDLSAVDWPARKNRFDVVYHLLSPSQNLRIRIKLEANEHHPVPSIVDVFPAAEWYEREAYDMYGVLFSGHPDLRRLLTDYGFEGHPMRKDFPLTGFVEVRYDDDLKKVVYDKVKLNQEFRDFDFTSPWEGTDYVLPGDERASGEGR